MTNQEFAAFQKEFVSAIENVGALYAKWVMSIAPQFECSAKDRLLANLDGSFGCEMLEDRILLAAMNVIEDAESEIPVVAFSEDMGQCIARIKKDGHGGILTKFKQYSV